MTSPILRKVKNRGRAATDEARYQAVRIRLAARALPEATVVVCGSPRSGTTWVGENLAALTDALPLFEPLHPGRTPAGDAGFGWSEFHDDDSIPLEQRAYLRRVLAGKVVNRWICGTPPIGRVIGARRLLVKSVRANGLLPVLAAEPSCSTPFVLLRHPVATVGSQLREGSWMRPESADFGPFLRFWPDFADAVAGLRHPEEYLAAVWASEFVAAENAGSPRPWMVAHYEDVRRDPVSTLEPVVARWGVASKGTADWEKPSRTASHGVVHDSGQHGLEPAQVRRIIAVVRRFGITAYADGPDPVCPLPLVAATEG